MTINFHTAAYNSPYQQVTEGGFQESRLAVKTLQVVKLNTNNFDQPIISKLAPKSMVPHSKFPPCSNPYCLYSLIPGLFQHFLSSLSILSLHFSTHIQTIIILQSCFDKIHWAGNEKTCTVLHPAFQIFAIILNYPKFYLGFISLCFYKLWIKCYLILT